MYNPIKPIAMRKIAEIRKELADAQVRLSAVDLKDQAAVDAAVAEVKSLLEELNIAELNEQAARRTAERQFHELEKEEGRSFSITKFIREAAEKKLTGLEAKAAEEGAKEFDRLGFTRNGFVIPSYLLRSSAGQNATTNADGGYAKSEMAPRYIDGLKQRLVVAQLGATVLGDLVGSLPLVGAGSITAAWAAEGAQGSVSKATFTRKTMTPHRNYCIGAFSKDLLRQTSLDIDAIVWGKILDAHAELLEAACIAGTGSSNQPTGILNTEGIGSVAGGTNGAAISWANVVALETEVRKNNARRGKLAYLTNSKVIGKLKTIEKASNTARFLLDDNGRLNGYNCEESNLVPDNLTKGSASGVCSAMIFGNFEDLYIGHWGGVDIVVDEVTLADQADIRIVLNSWDDCVVAEPKSFAAIKDITVA